MKKRGLSAARRSCNHRHAAIGQGKRRHRKSPERPAPAIWEIADQLIDGYHDYLLYIFRGRAFGARVQRVQKVQKVQRGRVLRMDGPSAQGFLGLTALQAEGCGGGFAADYKVSVTGLAFYIIWHDKHSADWLAALASPYPASPDFPLFRGQNRFLCFPAEA